jgi:hypothetical protein
LAGAGDGDVGEAGFGIVDGSGVGAGVLPVWSAGVSFRGAGEVIGDEDARPFASFGLVGGGDGDVCVRFGGEVGDGGEDGAGAVGVDEVDQRLEVPAGGVVGGVGRTGTGRVGCRRSRS